MILEKPAAGFHIGNINVAVPTCADDMLLMATSITELQLLLNLVTLYANEEHYVLHPVKSLVMPFNVTSKHGLDALAICSPWTINGIPLPIENMLVHLGIQRGNTLKCETVDHRILTARRTMYALMGAGFHGLNGLPVPTCLHLYQTYVLPRLTYGLETINLRKSELLALETFHRFALRCILGLPKRTAAPALYNLTGILPIEYLLDIKYLTSLYFLLSTEVTREVILRQYVVKDSHSSSIILLFKDLLQRYDLPTIYDLTSTTLTKQEWKINVKRTVHTKASNELAGNASGFKTLRFLAHSFAIKSVHSVIANCINSRQVIRANVKLRL